MLSPADPPTELLPKIADVIVYTAIKEADRTPERGFSNFISRENLSSRANYSDKNVKLGAGEIDVRVIAGYSSLSAVNFEIVDSQDFRYRRAALASENRAIRATSSRGLKGFGR